MDRHLRRGLPVDASLSAIQAPLLLTLIRSLLREVDYLQIRTWTLQ